MGNSCLRHFLKLFRERNRIHRSIFVHVQECMQSRYMVYYISLILPKASFFLDYKIPSLYLHVNNFVFCRQIFFIIKVNSIEKLFQLIYSVLLKEYVRNKFRIFCCAFFYINIWYGLSVRIRGTPKMPTGVKISSYDCTRP